MGQSNAVLLLHNSLNKSVPYGSGPSQRRSLSHFLKNHNLCRVILCNRYKKKKIILIASSQTKRSLPRTDFVGRFQVLKSMEPHWIPTLSHSTQTSRPTQANAKYPTAWVAL